MKFPTQFLSRRGFLSSSMGGLIATIFRPGQAATSRVTVAGPQIKIVALTVPDIHLPTVAPSWQDFGNIGSFSVENQASIVEVIFQGLVDVYYFGGAKYIQFSLAVDGTAPLSNTGSGYIGNHLAFHPIPISFAGYWQNLAPDISHAVNMWAKTDESTAQDVSISFSPGTSQIIVKEYLPFGFS